uniref:Uncharacterized protein n=1 Tax=Borrelia miyamotoi TaxID=47466 RepID=A0A482CXZ5_9SPIR|nr:hypothetical protein EZU71_06870 [Borrelia miyamotoi]
MRAFGDETLFTRKAIHNAAKTMLSYGATAIEVSQRMRMFGDDAGSNSAGLEKLAEVSSKVETVIHVKLEVLREHRSFGIDLTVNLEQDTEEASS